MDPREVDRDEPAPEAGGRAVCESLNILVVDDDIQCLSSLEELLARDGHWISTATRGFEALDIARRCRSENRWLELSILDCNVPDLSGLETFERLSRELPGMGAIFISGDSSAGLESEVMAAGGFALVRKPLDALRLRRAVREFQGKLAAYLDRRRRGPEGGGGRRPHFGVADA
jgi:DNA-binding NtrC family response regulator